VWLSPITTRDLAVGMFDGKHVLVRCRPKTICGRAVTLFDPWHNFRHGIDRYGLRVCEHDSPFEVIIAYSSLRTASDPRMPNCLPDRIGSPAVSDTPLPTVRDFVSFKYIGGFSDPLKEEVGSIRYE